MIIGVLIQCKNEKYLISATNSNILILQIHELRPIEVKYTILGFTAQQTKANRDKIYGARFDSLIMVKVGIKHRSQRYDRKRMGLESDLS